MKAVTLISTGIDSPVASYLMIKKIPDIIGVHCTSEPLDKSRSKELTIRMCKQVGIKKLYVTDHGTIQKKIAETCKSPLVCVLCKRAMVKIATVIAEKEQASAIVTGENLGQVASQTLTNMAIITDATSMQIFRPILCNDKQETIDIAKKIGTYEIGLDSPPCCSFVPDAPATKSRLKDINYEEKRIEIDSMIEQAISTAEIIDVD